MPICWTCGDTRWVDFPGEPSEPCPDCNVDGDPPDVPAFTTLMLQPADDIECPRCGQWHRVYEHQSESTTADRDFLYFRCGTGEYFAGARDRASRHPTRRVRR